MADKSKDWFAQAERDLQQAQASQREDRHEWAGFAAHQCGEKAVKALHLNFKQEAWGHVIARLLKELPCTVAEDMVEKAKVLDGFDLPTRYAMAIPRAPRLSTMERSTVRMPFVMPARSLNSSVLKWPDRQTVEGSLRQWILREAKRHPELCKLGYFGSYARGNWGVGSDLDLIAVVHRCGTPFEHRAAAWRTDALPVPTDLIAYTTAEYKRLEQQGGRFAELLKQEVIWIYSQREEIPCGQ